MSWFFATKRNPPATIGVSTSSPVGVQQPSPSSSSPHVVSSFTPQDPSTTSSLNNTNDRRSDGTNTKPTPSAGMTTAPPPSSAIVGPRSQANHKEGPRDEEALLIITEQEFMLQNPTNLKPDDLVKTITESPLYQSTDLSFDVQMRYCTALAGMCLLLEKTHPHVISSIVDHLLAIGPTSSKAIVRLLCSTYEPTRIAGFGAVTTMENAKSLRTLSRTYRKELAVQLCEQMTQCGTGNIDLPASIPMFLSESLRAKAMFAEEGDQDPMCEYLEIGHVYDSFYHLILANPTLATPLLDALTALVPLGGPPSVFQSEAENEPSNEAKNFDAFAVVARLVNLFCSTAKQSDGVPPAIDLTMRLPVLHAVLTVYAAHPKNFGLLERSFGVLSNLSRCLGEDDVHDEMLFMTIKIFELVSLGQDYRPITALSTLFRETVPKMIARHDKRRFTLLTSTMVKILERHPTVATDCGLFPALAPLFVGNR